MSLTSYLCGHLQFFDKLLENKHMNNTTNDTNMTGDADNGAELRTKSGQGINQGERVTVEALVDRFLSWRLPETVCADLCATTPQAGRYGTNLLSASEARQMIEHLLAATPEHGPIRMRFLAHRIDAQPPIPDPSGYRITMNVTGETKLMAWSRLNHLLVDACMAKQEFGVWPEWIDVDGVGRIGVEPISPPPPLYQIDKDGILRPLEHSSATAELERDEVGRITIRSCPETFVASREWLQEMIERNNEQIDQLAERDERLRKLANAADVLWEEHKAFSLECNGAEGMDQFGSDSEGHDMMQALVDETVAAVKGGGE